MNSRVFACRKKDTGRLYALKAMDKRLLKEKSAVHCAMRELICAINITSPFVCSAAYAFNAKNEVSIVQPLLPRGDLERFLLALPKHRFPEEIARFYAAEIVLSLKYLHSRGILHRDLKVRPVS